MSDKENNMLNLKIVFHSYARFFPIIFPLSVLDKRFSSASLHNIENIAYFESGLNV